MKKRGFLLLLTAVFLLSAVGCRRSPIQLPDAEYSVTITEEYRKAGGNTLKLMYPEILGYADAELQQTVNQKAAENAYALYEKRGLMPTEDGGYAYTAKEAVVLLASKDFYSIYISGVIESEAGGDPEFFAYTVNADLRTGQLLSTEDLISDYSGIAESFLDGKFQPDFGTENPEENFTRQSLIEQYKSEYGIYPYVYFREGQFGLVLETLQSLGGCAGYLTDIRNVSAFLNTDNPVVAMLCGME